MKEASRLAGVTNKTELVHMALQSLIAEYSRKRLIALGGTEKGLSKVPRRR